MDPQDGVLLIAAEYLQEAQEALREAAKAFIVHSDRFKEPYPDQPEFSPWNHPAFGVKRTADRCMRVRGRIAGALKHFPDAPKEPSICGECHRPVRDHKFREAMEHLLGMSEEESAEVVRRMFG